MCIRDSYSVTLMGKKRKEFTVNDQKFLCRYLNPCYLVNRLGIISHKGYAMANSLRATADLKFIQPNYHLDGEARLNQAELIKLETQLGYK